MAHSNPPAVAGCNPVKQYSLSDFGVIPFVTLWRSFKGNNPEKQTAISAVAV